MQQFPPYDSNGFYRMDGTPDPRGCYGPPSPPDEYEVKTALAFLSLLRPTKHPTCVSYGLKHDAEHWGRENGMSAYVSNGALIAAAIQLGLVVKPYSINAAIGVSRQDVKRVRNA